ncbi:Xylose operon regulatory protein [Rubripirellula obstinata]|uniref:Xylose operon regulatory protein n=1 Tax=Rubripirellula obstinata TaxID=406547 RepID=A0A5B1CLR7_9BACT|nr:helix-turn-helix domain-containing protein [Rubripirellula obstinata]KAA1262028.1 Xylose operon regulatory protein [Rubripirellula obstinata]
MPRQTILVWFPDRFIDRLGVIDGVFDYAKTCRQWHVETAIGDWARLQFLAGSATVAGLISVRQITPPSQRTSNWITEQPFPTVLIENHLPGVSSIATDTHAILELAQSQWDQLVVNEICLATRYSDDPLWSAVERTSSSMNVACRKWVLPSTANELKNPRQLEEFCETFVSSVNRTAVIAADPRLAIDLRAAASRCDVRFPEQMSIISTRDAGECSLPTHSVTSIEEPNRELGFQAARLIDRLLDRTASPGQRILIAPTKLHVRESCCGEFNHPSIALATNFIQENATTGISVEDVLKTQDLSRVTFERRFRQATGQSPAEMIRKTRVEKAKELLLETEDSIARIAELCGFSTTAKFSAFFSKIEGMSPLRYRRRFGRS